MSELVYSAPEERKSRLEKIKGFFEQMGAGVVQASELNSGIIPTEMKPHQTVGMETQAFHQAVEAPTADLSKLTIEQRAIVDEAENPLLPRE